MKLLVAQLNTSSAESWSVEKSCQREREREREIYIERVVPPVSLPEPKVTIS